tara:strand:- start:215 stop:592 length:378 start_codon:yes stop_codon:yes gene_type:complete
VTEELNGDCIQLRELRVVCVVGVLPEERERPQPLEIDIDIYTDLSAAGRSDDLNDTLDYGEVAATVTQICASAEAQLLEYLGQLVVDQLLASSQVSAVDVTIKKLRPPVPLDIEYTAIRLVRHRQ